MSADSLGNFISSRHEHSFLYNPPEHPLSSCLFLVGQKNLSAEFDQVEHHDQPLEQSESSFNSADQQMDFSLFDQQMDFEHQKSKGA